MVFSSHLFLFYFLPLALGFYYGVPTSWRLGALTLSSLAFYAWANPWFVMVLLSCASIDYCCGNMIAGHWHLPWLSPNNGTSHVQQSPSRRWRRFFVGVSLTCNISLLLFFKYAMFVGDNLRYWLGLDAATQPAFLILLPIGISFYTFESISYILDLNAGRAQPASRWLHRQAHDEGRGLTWSGYWWIELRGFIAYTCYLTQFPHLVAGPIIRYQDLEPQLHERRHSLDQFARGVAFFTLGLAKKVLLANYVGSIADAAFAATGLAWYDAWYGAVAYAFQLYFDFSGYTDMAIGLALMVGFTFPKNFNAPYRAESLTDFWRRWHISLSTWLRDYLYIPLGGSRCTPRRAYANLLVVMLVGGFWHGASWTFLAWGGIHGVILAGERVLGKSNPYRWLPKPGRVAFTFALVCVAWVFFRSTTIGHAIDYCATMLGLVANRPEAVLFQAQFHDLFHLLLVSVCAGVVWWGVPTWDFTQHLRPAKAGWCLVLLMVAIAVLWGQSYNPFLYFRF